MIDSLIAQAHTPAPIVEPAEIQNLLDIVRILHNGQYDYIKAEPTPEIVTLSFVTAEVIKETKDIKFPVYNTILHEVKKTTGLDTSLIGQVQEGK
jgi:hypothetical protein